MKIIFSLFMLLQLCCSWSQDRFPGGVPGAEAWYIVNHSETSQSSFPNHADTAVKFTPCSDNAMTNNLFNFNHSVKASHLCITYNAPLEISTSRNIFFVGEPTQASTNYSHLTTYWRSGLTYSDTTSNITNRFDTSNQNVYISSKKLSYQSVNNANVNFYNVNIYQREKRTKSYGMYGETSFYIGKGFTSVTPPAQYFSGNFPEFISFPYELTANEKNRVESYLALKYGITLAQGTTYRNSQNTVFWNGVNYNKFYARIFGIGRDDISGLNQLQSESVHNKDYLISSVGPLAASNPDKQASVSIENNNFIVFGDNGQADLLQPANDQQVRLLGRKWLSQNTGDKSPLIPMYFKLNLAGAINQAMTADPHLKLWMLHDKYVTNQTVSDFTSQNVNYYPTSSMDALLYGYFSKVSFDPDKAVYDQFTFGVGPEMIVQVRFEQGDCDDNKVKSYVVITGGKAPYDINIQNTNGYNEDFTSNENTLAFTAIAPDTYTVNVTDASGNAGEVSVDVAVQQVPVNLGPDVVLNASQQQVTLNAGVSVLDPTATYQWYKDGEILQEFSSILTVTEPGEYTVIVTSGNQMCQQTDTIKVFYTFHGYSHPANACEDELASVAMGLSGGVAPYIVTFTGANETYAQVFNTDTFTVTGLEYGYYDFTVTDNTGNSYTEYIDLPEPLDGIDLDLEGQIAQICDPYPSSYTYPVYNCIGNQEEILDASQLVTNQNVSYEWYMNGQSMNIFSPSVIMYYDYIAFPGDAGYNSIQVVVTNLDNGCKTSEIIGIIRLIGIRENENYTQFRTAKTAQRKQQGQPGENGQITAKVFPNPAAINTEFYYEVSSTEVINGTIEIHSPNGALLQSEKVSGKTSYSIPFTLTTSGTYLITINTGETTLTNKVIIK